MRTILIGLGNPILGDDATGWRVVERVEQQLQQKSLAFNQEIDILYLSIGGLELMERLIGYDRAVIVDAISSENPAPGSVSIHALEEVPDISAGHTTSVHDASLQNSLRLAQNMSLHLPESVIVVGVETNANFEFSEELTEAVEAALPRAVEVVMGLLSSV